MRVSLPYPDKCLWPNGGQKTHFGKIARLKKKHKAWAWLAAQGQTFPVVGDLPIPVHLIVYAKPKGPLPDRDNCIAAMKAYQDGIAEAIGIDDKHFAEPKVTFSDVRNGHFVIEVGE